VMTWPDDNLTISAVASAGIGLLVESGTGQALRVWFRWYE
jgi:hypothetical protein